MSRDIVYSIIIPHKNSPVLLDRLLDSIPLRSDLQIIVVDDNSDQDKRPIIKREGTTLIQLKEGEACGAGNARNVGLTYANGKWLLFADADDSYTENLNTVLDKYADDDETDMVILNARGCKEDGSYALLRQNIYVNNFLKGRIYSEKVIRYGFWNPWSRMVKRKLVEKYHIRFEQVPFANDMMFCLNCSKYAHKILVEKDFVYNYFMPVGRSITDNNRKKISNIEVAIDNTKRQSKFYEDVNYLFKLSHLAYLLRPNIDKKAIKEYRSKYFELLREKDVSLVKDSYYFVIFLIGRLFKII